MFFTTVMKINRLADQVKHYNLASLTQDSLCNKHYKLEMILEAPDNIDCDEDSNEDTFMAAYIQAIARTPEQCQTIEQASSGERNEGWMQKE